GMFGAMALIGYTTKLDLSKLGTILLMALIGLIIAMVVNFFLANPILYWIVSIGGVVIFSGLTAYDTQWIKRQAMAVGSSGNSDAAHRIALIGAFHLFLDFVNLFLSLLRIFGRGN
ncbi:MAG: Bax inhibitor-1/YccA family protein, partial [Ktedonobacterales bacterium]